MRMLAVGVAIGVVVAATSAVILARRGGGDAAHPTLAERAAKNYRFLSKAQSRVLVRYAESVYDCVVVHGAKVASPVASSTRIVMSAPHQTADGLLRFLEACDAQVGPPPPKSSLQARAGQILVYVPKQCLLDPTEVGGQRT